MFTINHLADMADLFVGLHSFLDKAPEHHVAALAMVLAEYQNHGCYEDGPADPSFGAILMEVGGICADAAESGTVTIEPYRGALLDKNRLDLAAQAVVYASSRHATPQGMASACQALIDAQKAPAAESKPAAKKGPQAVKPAAKSKRKRKAA
jgi:hypothetical protein